MSSSSDSRAGAREEPHSSTATSRTLLDRIKADDAAAWDRLVGLYAPLVYRWCRRWDLPEQEIADVFQDVFQAVATHIGEFRKERAGDTFRGWLRTIAHNKVRDHFRKLGREPGGAGGTDAQIRLRASGGTGRPMTTIPATSTRIADSVGRALDLIRDEFEERTWRAFWLTAVEDRAPRRSRSS